jgi:hypothetical protein
MELPGKNRRQWVAFSASNVRFSHHTPGLGTKCIHLDLLFDKWKRAHEPRFQGHIAAGICQQDPRHRAGAAHFGLPGEGSGVQQAAFLPLPSPKIISIKITAFFAGWSAHLDRFLELSKKPLKSLSGGQPEPGFTLW